MKLVIYSVVSAAMALGWGLVRFTRKLSAKRRFAEYEAGTRCSGCDAASVRVANGWVSCERCGYLVELATVRANRLSEGELKIATDVDRSRALR